MFSTCPCTDLCSTGFQCEGPACRGLQCHLLFLIHFFPLRGHTFSLKPQFPCLFLLNCLFLSCSLPLIPKSNIRCWFKCTANFLPGVRVLEAQTLHPAEASSLNSGYSGSFAKAPHLKQVPHLLWATGFSHRAFLCLP